MKKSLYSLFILAYSINISAQSWMEMMKNPSANLYDIQASFENYWKDSSKAIYIETGKLKDNQPLIEKRLPGWKIFKRWEYMMEPRLYPSGDRSVMTQAMNEYMNDFYFNTTRSGGTGTLLTQAANWSSLGPNTLPGGGGGTGRLNFVRFDPTNSNTMYVGAPSGGLWKSTNGGSSWTTSSDQLAVIGCSDIAINPSNTQVMYLATGDCDADDTYSVGVLKSTNGGTSWSTTGLNWGVNSYRTISRLIINPLNPNTLFAATSIGIYRTRNAGATWTAVSTGSYYDIEFKPGDTTTIYACTGSKFYRSTNGGTSFINITSGLPASGVYRLSLAVTAANDDYIYLLGTNSAYGYYGLYRSTDGGTSFSARSTTPNILGWNSDGSGSGGQGWYDLAVAASPTNADNVFVGGINIWSSTNGGSSWTNSSYWASSGSKYVHADVHDIQFLPGSGTTIFATSDGGIFKSTNTGSIWTISYTGLCIGQIYKLGLSAKTSALTVTGWQDNGSYRLNGTSWSKILGGDGMECLIDWNDNNIQYASLYYGEINKTTTGGSPSTTIVNSGGTGVHEDGAWVTPYIQSQKSATKLFFGKSQVYKSTNAGSSWAQVGSISGGTGKIVALANAPSNGNYIYAAKGNRMFASTNGTSFTDVSSGLPVSSLSITYIAIHPTDPNKVWVTFSGYTSASKVYYSANAGSSWTNYSTGLPNLPVNCIVYDKNSTNSAMYVGTDVGVYYRDNSMGSWTAYNTGLPNVIVNELEIQYSLKKLRAATYGRGVWETDLYGSGVGIENNKISDNDFNIYPNPNDGNFTISFNTTEKTDFTIEVHNSIGQQMLRESANNVNGEFIKQYDLQEFGAGLYFISLYNGNSSYVKKIIVK